ncbi:MAG: ATP-binding protein [Lachnospiraceae bacterium]|nr:ATP-binding protein [Lachnospiraceae bacterium]
MKKLYPRETYLKKIRGFYDEDEIIKVITGVRRCGKSSLLEMIIEELQKRKVPDNNIIMIHLDKKPYKSIKVAADLEKIIDDKSKDIKGLKYLFIDEIQNVKGFEETINAYREEGDYSIFITGSNSYLLSGELATKLTGRYIEFEMSTLSFDEYIGMKKFYGKEASANLEDEFDRYMLEGGFPYTVRLETFADKRLYSKNVIDEIFEKDIRKNKRIKNRQMFETIQRFIINNFGSTMSIKGLCEYLANTTKTVIRKETVYNYLSILENAKIIRKCTRFDMKSKKSLRGEEKYYLSDLSFYFTQNTDNRIEYGPVLENIIYNYAKSRGYDISVGRIGKLEVDFILRDMDMNYSYVQVARYIDNGNIDENGKNITEEREYRPLEQIRDSYPKYVMTLDRLLQKRSGIHHKNIISFIEKGELF